MKWIFKVLGVLVGLYLVAAVAVLVFSRMARGGSGDRIRRFNRDTLNPWMLQRAGGEHWYASVVKHVGRHSGAEYETPVVMHEIDERLAIPLPYGRDVDWMLNLEHHEGGTAAHKGEEFVVSDPVIVTRASIAEGLGFRDALRYRVFGVDEFVTLRAEAVTDGDRQIEDAGARDEVLV